MTVLALSAPRMRLHSGAPWWLVHDGLADAEPDTLADADVTIVGAGITGALVGDALASAGLRVTLIDRRLPAAGSTSVSTALLQYELDRELVELIDLVGEADAVAAYRQSAQAISDIEALTATLPDDCGFARRTSIYLASRRRDTPRLEREAAARARAGLDVEYRSATDTESDYGLPGHGALRTSVAAVIDPVRLTRALLTRARSRGARIMPWTTAVSLERRGADLSVLTDRGPLRTQFVVLASGYEIPPGLRPDIVQLHSTYALITEPSEVRGPLDECLVWESARPYTYMRSVGQRLVIGGMDIPHRDDLLRDRQLPDRTRRLERELRRLIPDCDAPTAYSWAGTFAETTDGMPLIGPLPGCDRVFYALGYGGNGITFSVIASQLLRDLCLGKPNPLAHTFRADR